MSFFSEILDLSIADSIKDEIAVELVMGTSVRIIGKLKIDNMTSDEIVLKNKKNKVKIFGTNLNICSMAKGEMEIEGNVSGVVRE